MNKKEIWEKKQSSVPHGTPSLKGSRKLEINCLRLCLSFIIHSTFYAMSVVVTLFEAKTAVTARPGTRSVQVDIDFGMTQWAASSVTYCFPTFHNSDRLVCDESHGTKRIWLKLHSRLFKARTGTTRGSSALVFGPCRRVIGSLCAYNGSGRSRACRRWRRDVIRSNGGRCRSRRSSS